MKVFITRLLKSKAAATIKSATLILVQEAIIRYTKATVVVLKKKISNKNK